MHQNDRWTEKSHWVISNTVGNDKDKLMVTGANQSVLASVKGLENTSSSLFMLAKKQLNYLDFSLGRNAFSVLWLDIGGLPGRLTTL